MSVKRTLSLSLIIIASSLLSALFAGTPIQQSELPKEAQAFIAKYFSNEQIKKVEKDNGRRGAEYEVDFISGAEIEFLSDGQWKEVKVSRGNSVPVEIAPSAIAKYISDNFNGLVIEEISRERGGYEIELSNGTELKLTEDGKPMQRNGGKGKRRH